MARLRRHTEESPGPRGVTAWRAELLRGAGFGAEIADRLARDGRYDIHALLELVDRGCPAELAARILAPLDEDTGQRC